MYDYTDFAIESYSSLLAWFTSIPSTMGGYIIYDIVSGIAAYTQSMDYPFTSTSGWATPTRPFSYGEWRFDGINDWIPVPLMLADRVSYSIVTWVKCTGSIHNYIFQESSYDNLIQISLVIGEDLTGDIQFFVLDDLGGSTAIVVSGNGYNDSKWHHIAATYTSSFVELFVDGKSIGSSSNTLSSVSTQHTAIGARADGTGFFEGSIDDVRIYKHALKAAEVNYLYERGRKEWPVELLRIIDNPYIGSIRDIQGMIK